MKRYLWGVVPFTVLLSSVIFNIIVTSRASTIGTQVWVMEKERQSLERQNDILEVQIADIRSLHSIQDEAISSGFLPRHKVIVITSVDPPAGGLALNQTH